uniref:Kringle-like domain-containing protein n=1 Tax=Setaria digitata TaxID=48799 RepID=A0A915PLD4_9BILA
MNRVLGGRAADGVGSVPEIFCLIQYRLKAVWCAVMKSGWTVLFVLFVKSKPSPYFEFDDMFNTECIPTDHLKDYLYYGKVSTYIERSGLMTSSPSPAMRSASSVLGRCEIWKSVVNVMVQWAINHSIKDYWTYPDEFMSHDNCRNFDLTQKDKNSNDHLAVRMKIIEPNASAVDENEILKRCTVDIGEAASAFHGSFAATRVLTRGSLAIACPNCCLDLISKSVQCFELLDHFD